MKKTNMIYALLLTGAFASCQKNEVSNLQENTKDRVNFTLSASSDGPTFRTGHADGEGKLAVTWEKGDKIGLFSVVGTETKNANAAFSILEDSDITEAGKKADFSGEISLSGDWNMDFYTYYPYTIGKNDPKKIAVSVADQVIDGKESKHLAKYDVLIADPVKGVKAGDENTSLNFKHIMAIADLNISLPAGAESEQVKQIRIQRADGALIATGGTLDITAEAETDRLTVSSTAEQQSWTQITKVENVNLAAGESFHARVALIPADWSSETISIFVDTDKGTYQFDKINIKAEAGKRYNSSLVLENKVPVAVGDYYYADGTWSTEIDANKTVVGVVGYVGQKGGASNGYVVSLEDVNNGLKGKLSLFNIPEISGTQNSAQGEDWDGQAHTRAVAAKRTEDGYKDMNFILQSVDYAPANIINGPAAQGNWYTPAVGQLTLVAENYAFIQSRLLAISADGIAGGQRYWSSTEVGTDDPESVAAKRNVRYVIISTSSAGFATSTSTTYPVRPYLSF